MLKIESLLSKELKTGNEFLAVTFVHYTASKTVEGGWWGNRAQNPFA